ncbi:response regulator [Chromatium okenii]|uniref:response regulator transcription factor n=1 Tax=Chromatium okenii TaxID=61644 RepID=UPI001907A75C|nr:response regulator [Chromatium okenii]MBK1641906.1 response regulator [Chromatium okenii]
MPTPLLLIVDDSKMARMMVRQFVTELRPEWRLMEATNGDEALALIKQQPPEFVSLDVNMPGISGLEVAARLRLHHPEIRIVICSANIQEAVRKAAEKAGVKFVAKPITPATIANMVTLFEE